MREQGGGDAPRDGAPLEIVEAEFLLAIGQHRDRRPGPQWGGQLGVLLGDVGGVAAVRVVKGGGLADELRGDLVLFADLFDLLPDRGQRQADHPLAQRHLGRRHLAELQEAHQGAHRRRRHQQGEQDKARGQHADELPDFGRQRGFLGRGQRQRQRDRAAHPAPQHDDLVAGVDRAGDPGEAQERDQPVKGQRAGDQRGRDQRAEQCDIAPGRAQQQLGRLHRREQEDQRARPEGELLPRHGKALEIGGRHTAPAASADRERRGGDRHDPGKAEVMVANDEDEIGKADRQGRLGEPARPQDRHAQGDEPAGQIADREAAPELAQERQDAVERARRAVAGQHRDGERIDRDRRSVVEQAFALHQGRQPPRRADVAENRDDSDRIGRRDDRAQNDAGDDADRRDRPQRKADDKGADDDADHREQQNRRQLVAELADIDIEGRLEQQRRQEDVEQRFGAEAKVAQRAQDVADDAAGVVGRRDVGNGADRDPHQGQQYGIGNGEPLGERQQQADEPEECRDGKDGQNGFVHGGLGGQNRSGRAWSSQETPRPPASNARLSPICRAAR